jgi:endonuclease III
MAKRESIGELKARAARISKTLARLHPEARISLDFKTPWQCLAATIMSAQCTDERVNQVTPALFEKYPDPAAMAAADPREVERMIVTTGFFRQKTRSLMAAAQDIVERFGNKLPDTMEDLVTLRGVGRKTANVVLGHVHGKPGLVVDTHVRRVSFRLGLTKSREPEVIERDLCAILAPSDWTPFSMRLILHGRQVCEARNPRCPLCGLLADCPQIGVTVVGKKPTTSRKPKPAAAK